MHEAKNLLLSSLKRAFILREEVACLGASPSPATGSSLVSQHQLVKAHGFARLFPMLVFSLSSQATGPQRPSRIPPPDSTIPQRSGISILILTSNFDPDMI